MEPWWHFCLMRRKERWVGKRLHAPTSLCPLCCGCWSAADVCSYLRTPDAALGAALTDMGVFLHTATCELISSNPGGGRFEPSAGRQALMKSIKLSTFREHCFTKPLKHTMQQTAELGLSACVESERAMLLFRGLKTTLQSRALIFFILFLAIIQMYLKRTSAFLLPL